MSWFEERSMKIEVQSPGDEAHAALDERLMAFNIKQRPCVNWQKDVFTVVLKDGSGNLRGSLLGRDRFLVAPRCR